MGSFIKITGAVDEIKFNEDRIKTVDYIYDSPDDADAKTSDASVTVVIHGKIITSIGGDEFDDCLKLAKWSQIQGEQADTYRAVEITQVAAGKVVRKYTLTNAFLVDLNEKFGDEYGEGEFIVKIRQKKDNIRNVAIDGGYAEGE